MNDCISLNTTLNELPPNKRVQHVFGMVMGVDDFRQDQVHFEWKHRLSNMLLHGYGTVCGLAVTHSQTNSGDVEVRIASGYAITPGGNWIWVEREQCAQLGAWLANNDPTPPPLGTRRRLYVTLCYDECYTDLAPIAASACAPEQETQAPSRVLESFKANFSWDPPQQQGEELARAFGRLLSRVEITTEIESPAIDDSEQLLQAVCRLGTADTLASPPESPPVESSPPDDDVGPYLLPAEEACNTLRRALNIWITEVCPRLRQEESEECVLLACIDFQGNGGAGIDVASVSIQDCDRPVLVSDRLKQELFCLVGDRGIRDHSELDNLDADDHLQYLRTDGTRALTGDLSAGNNRITRLAAATADGDAVPFEQAVKVGDPAGGDLRGVYPDPRLARIQGNTVNAPNPQDSQLLIWRNNEWVADELALGELDDVSVPIPPNRPNDGEVLTWDDGQRAWIAARPTQETPGDSGDHVLAPFGSFGIVAAGNFRGDGSPRTSTSIYGDLTVDALSEGRYRLSFPLYDVAQQNLTYVVKATIFDERWQESFLNVDDDALLREQSVGIVEDVLRYPGTVQVVGFDDAGILIWITQSVLNQEFIRRLVAGDQIGDGVFMALNFRPVSLPFMVEISAFGENLPGFIEDVIDQGRIVDLNAATVELLVRLPGITLGLAEAILAARPPTGFSSVDDLLNVSGIGPVTLRNIRPMVIIR